MVYYLSNHFAGVLELADETDSNSVVHQGVWVRVPPPAPKQARPAKRGPSTEWSCLSTKPARLKERSRQQARNNRRPVGSRTTATKWGPKNRRRHNLIKPVRLKEDPPRSGLRSVATRETRLAGFLRGLATKSRETTADPLGSRTKKPSIHIKNAHNP